MKYAIEMEIENKKAKLIEYKTKNVLGIAFSWNNKKFFLVIGEHINGGFAAVINKNVSCELSCFEDKFYNREHLSRIIKSKNNVEMLVNVIADKQEYNFQSLETREISVDYNGYNFLVIFGKYENIPFCLIPNWQISCQLSRDLNDITGNTAILSKILKNKENAYVIASVIAQA